MRSTLSWEYCDICKRRIKTSICKINDNEIIRVCPYCMIIISDIIACNGTKKPIKENKESLAKRKIKKGVNEEFLKNIDRDLKNIKSQ